MLASCPALTPEVLNTVAETLSANADFSPAPLPGPRQPSTHKMMYAPLLRSVDDQLALRAIIRAN